MLRLVLLPLLPAVRSDNLRKGWKGPGKPDMLRIRTRKGASDQRKLTRSCHRSRLAHPAYMDSRRRQVA